MTKNYVVIASTDHVYVWNYRSSSQAKGGLAQISDSTKFGRELAFFIDEEPNAKMIYDKEKYDKGEKLSNEPICCLTANEGTLIIGRTNGIVNKYTLPNLILEKKQALNGKPNNIFINCDGTRLAIIDLANLLTFYKLDVDGNDEVLPFEKKDVWNFKWASENSLNCTFLEKYRLQVMTDMKIETPITTDAYIADFSEMVIKTINIEAITTVFDGDDIDLDEYIYWSI